MNQYETVEVLEKLESEVNSKPIIVSLEVQCKINEEGKKSFPYPVLKVNINGRDQFFFIDIAIKIHELMGALMPKAIEEKAAADAAFRARKEKWESQNNGRQDDRGGGGGRKVGTHGGRKDSRER